MADDFEADWNEAVGKLGAELVGAVEEAIAEGAREARSTHRFVNRTGDAESSIEPFLQRVTSNGAEGLIECSVPYAAVLADGSKPHRIEPRKAAVLRFQVGGRWVSSHGVDHPGTRPDPFMDNALAKAEIVLDACIATAIDKAFP